MKIRILIIFIFTFVQIYGQENLCNEVKNENKYYKSENEIEKYNKYDFSNLWIKTENEAVFGIIGENYQRILIKIIFVERTLSNPNEYLVYGKSSVKSNVCNFVGKITIININELKVPTYGVDEQYRNYGIKYQGRIIAKYEFFENRKLNNSGQFNGILQSNWYLTKDDRIKYDDIEDNADGYINNAFVGKWKMYNSNLEKICNWGDYRVPNVKCDFDIGAGELGISEKYTKNGWKEATKKDWWK